jgi:hypothetical protein
LGQLIAKELAPGLAHSLVEQVDLSLVVDSSKAISLIYSMFTFLQGDH